MVGMAGFVGMTAAAAELDFGDFTSSTLTTKAWEALGEDKEKEAIAYADKCIELYTKEALKMQKGLKEFANDSEAGKLWALNDVGTCYFIKGKALAKQKKAKDAIVAYTYLKDRLGYSQCWDTNGWFWHPAESAVDEIADLK
jgi:hypothetical protein